MSCWELYIVLTHVIQGSKWLCINYGQVVMNYRRRCKILRNSGTCQPGQLIGNGFGNTPSQTDTSLRYIESLFPLLPDSPDVYPVWRRLVVKYKVLGVQVHDARLAASMIVHKVKHILTFNVTDFERYKSEGIVAVDPATV